MNKTLNLKASKAIQSLGVEVESEKCWYRKMGKWYVGNCKTMMFVWNFTYPAPSFTELILALPEIGEKLGFPDKYCKSGAGCDDSHTMHEGSCVWEYESPFADVLGLEIKKSMGEVKSIADNLLKLTTHKAE